MTTPHPTRIARAQRKPETFRSYRVADTKPESRIDWEMAPVQCLMGLCLLMIGAIAVFGVLAVAAFLWVNLRWWSILAAAGVCAIFWLAWLIGRRLSP